MLGGGKKENTRVSFLVNMDPGNVLEGLLRDGVITYPQFLEGMAAMQSRAAAESSLKGLLRDEVITLSQWREEMAAIRKDDEG